MLVWICPKYPLNMTPCTIRYTINEYKIYTGLTVLSLYQLL
jgi:hypothetical protein